MCTTSYHKKPYKTFLARCCHILYTKTPLKLLSAKTTLPFPLLCAGNTRTRSVRMSVVLEVSANIWDIRYQSGMDCMRGHDIMSTLDGGRGACKNRGPHRFPHMNADRGGKNPQDFTYVACGWHLTNGHCPFPSNPSPTSPLRNSDTTCTACPCVKRNLIRRLQYMTFKRKVQKSKHFKVHVGWVYQTYMRKRRDGVKNLETLQTSCMVGPGEEALHRTCHLQ